MAVPKVTIVRTGLANLASILAGFRRAGAEPVVTESARDVEEASHVILPGVGAFGPAMQQLDVTGMTGALKDRMAAGKPTLSVCLGLQLLHATSEENPGIHGLGIVSGKIRRFPDGVRIPQLGWNSVEPDSSCVYIQPGFAYFANSFCSASVSEGWAGAYSDYGIKFVAAMENGAVLACQFHPELSGAWGLELLRRWLVLSPERGGVASC